jgi:hypothetical protein
MQMLFNRIATACAHRAPLAALVAGLWISAAGTALAGPFTHDDILLSVSQYSSPSAPLVVGTTALPNGAFATATGAYPGVWAN